MDQGNNMEPTNRVCGDHCGILPSCAPLAVSYVPMQQENSRRYGHDEALANGTLFPGLNLPFHLKVEASPVQNGPLSELQALDFVLAELGLYLDTHQNDSEAFGLFQQYAKLAKEGRKRYEALYGPIKQSAASMDQCYTWLHDPWPWEYKKDGGRK